MPDRFDWTPDGRRLIVLLRGPAAALLSIPADGNSIATSPLRTRSPWDSVPFVSPDGSKVAYASQERTPELWVMSGLFPSGKAAAASR